MGIRIRGVGSYVPERVLTNADLEKMVDTSDEWIVTRTGIRQRHIAAPEQACSDIAAGAAKAALANCGMDATELDLIIVSTISPDMAIPNTAALVQHKIGAAKCPAFDIEAACTGLLYNMNIAYGMMSAPKLNFRRVMIIGAEKLTSLVDWTDRGTCVLFGDGASAMILENDGDPITPDFLVNSLLGADGQYGPLLCVPAGGSARPASAETVAKRLHYVSMQGGKTFQLAVISMTRSCQLVLREAGLTMDQVRWAIPHQANDRIIDAVATRLKAEDKVFRNIENYGNTSSASIGIALDELNHKGLLARGDYILVTAFGAGLTWGAVLLRW